jgi:hypothetical protein
MPFVTETTKHALSTTVTMTGGSAQITLTLSANVTYVFALFSHHATPASLASLALTSLNTSPQTIGTVSHTTGAGRRITAFYVRSSVRRVNEVFTITADNAINQNLRVYVGTWGSVDAIGVPVANFKSDVLSSANAMTLTFDDPIVGPNSGHASFFMSSVNGTAMGSRTSWTERNDIDAGNFRAQAQVYNTPDTAASCTAGTGVLLGIAIEMVAVPNPVPVQVAAFVGVANNVTPLDLATSIWPGLNLFAVSGSKGSDWTQTLGLSSYPNVQQILVGSPIHVSDNVPGGSGPTILYVWAYWSDVFIPSVTMRLEASPNTGGFYLVIRHYVMANVDRDANPPYGILQMHDVTSPAGAEMAMDPFASANSPVFALWVTSVNNLTGTPTDGYREYTDDNQNPLGVHHGMASVWRANADPFPTYVLNGSDYAGVAFEFAVLPIVVEGVAPTITLIDPPVGALDPNDPIVATITDVDGDLSTVLAYFVLPDGTPQLALDGSALTNAGLTATFEDLSDVSTIVGPDGIQITLQRTTPWAGPSLTLQVIAFDAEGHRTDAAFTWSVGASATALPKLELRIRVPTGGWAFQLTDANGTNVAKTFPAGDYYLNSVAPGGTLSFCAQLAALCTAGSMVYAVTVDDDTDNATGKTTMAANGAFTLTWVNTLLRDQLGFTGSSVTGPTVVGANHAKGLWLPTSQRTPREPDPVLGESGQDFGRPEADYLVTRAPSGATTQSVFSRRRSGELDFQTLLGHKMWLSDEQILNESFERFWIDQMDAGGVPFRYHNNRANDAVYWTLVWKEEAGQIAPEPHIEGWVGVRSIWRLQLGVFKYIPLQIGGVWD